MFEYHGWAVIRDDTYECDAVRLSATVAELKRIKDRFGTGSGVVDVREVNASVHVWFAGHPNHRHKQVLELFPWLASHAPGSYGLLYIWDDEDAEFDNEFQVWRLRRGEVQRLADPFLSPCVPEIEDPYDPSRED